MFLTITQSYIRLGFSLALFTQLFGHVARHTPSSLRKNHSKINRPRINICCGTGSKLTAALTIALLSLSACNVGGEKGAYASFGAEGWRAADTVAFLPDSAAMGADSSFTADIALAVRHTNGYEYSNLWVELTYLPAGHVLCARDTFNIVLADNLGRWLGSGIGVDYQRVDTLLRSVSISSSAPVTVRHIMRTDTLPQIQQVGIILDSTKNL